VTPSDITGGAGTGIAPKKRLAEEFTAVRRLMRLDQLDPNGALMLQSMYIAGAQACFKILQRASKLSAEECLVVWGELQSEILNAMPKREEKLVEMPPEKRLII
jgi:hypothetical protein